MARRLLLLLLSSFLFPCSAFAALPATGVIEIRASAAANNVNGGGYNSARGGTDYSLQDTAQIATNNTDGSAVGTTTFTNVLATFTSVMVGNYLHITATGTGLTTGWYEIVTFTDAHNVVLDRTPGTGTGATYYVGGAMSMNSTLDDDLFEIGVAGNKFWIKGDITLGEAVSTAASGGSQNPIVVEGYTTTRGDGTTAANRPTVTQAANSWTAGSNWNFYNIIFTGTADPTLTIGGNGKLINCKVTNTSTTASRISIQMGSDSILFNCEAISYRGRAVNLSSVTSIVSSGYFHDSDVGIRSAFTTGQFYVDNNIISDNVTAAFALTAAFTNMANVKNNTLYGAENKLGIGVSLATGVTDVRLIDNIIYGFVTGVSHADTQSVGYDNYNDYKNNTNDVSAAGQWQKGANDVTTAPGFASVNQLTGINATSSTNVLTGVSGTPFSTATANVDFVYLSAGSGTGIGLVKYLITSVNAGGANITVSSNITSSGAGSAISWQITTGHDFSIGTNLKALGFPGVFQGGLTTGYMDIGGVQRQEAGGTTTDVFGMIQ